MGEMLTFVVLHSLFPVLRFLFTSCSSVSVQRLEAADNFIQVIAHAGTPPPPDGVKK